MSHIPSQFSPAGFSARQNALSDAQLSNYVRQKSITAEESLEAGLKITTKEGDVVTLNSSSYAKLDAYSYNSRGVVQTEDGTAMVKQMQREVTLSSGESFSFTVSGDLNEDELADIEAIVKDIDEIIEEMAEGDMDEAVSLALGMGGYDTVSAYSADITYEKSVSRRVEREITRPVIAEPPKAPPETEASDLIDKNIETMQPEKPIPPVEPWPENSRPWKQKSHSVKSINNFMDKMAERFEEMEENQLAEAKNPIDKLFEHHIEKAESKEENKSAAVNFFTEARRQVEVVIEQITSRAFERQFSALVDDE